MSQKGDSLAADSIPARLRFYRQARTYARMFLLSFVLVKSKLRSSERSSGVLMRTLSC